MGDGFRCGGPGVLGDSTDGVDGGGDGSRAGGIG